ncbi:MAG: hypothetical protein K1X71_17085 [Pirellulales bacterium]|nr:hypothetical protein [Pirellulales bacterium]
MSNTAAQRECRSNWHIAGLAPGVRLALAVLAIAAIWLVVLPRIGALPMVREYIAHNEALGINPAGKFYSEVPAMLRLLDRDE